MKIGYAMEAGVPDVRRPDASGAAQHVWQTIRALERIGHQVRLLAQLDGVTLVSDDLTTWRPVTLTGGGPTLGERAVRRVQSTLRLPYVSWFDSRRFAAACVQELADCDLLYERMGWMGLGTSDAAAALGIPHVLEVNGDLLPELAFGGKAPAPLQRAASLSRMRRITRRATHTVATGAGWRARHIEQWGVAPAQVSVVQNGTALVDLLTRDRLRAFAEDVDADRGPLQVAYVGSFDPWQGLPTLLSVVARMKAVGAPISLRVAGGGVQQPALHLLAKQFAIEDCVDFCGHVPVTELAGILGQCDVGVSLYQGRAEFTGLKLLDYKAAGLATVAFGEHGQPDVIAHGRTGLIVSPGDDVGVERALLALHRDRRRLREMGRSARLAAEAEHSWIRTAQALDRVFQTLVSEPRIARLAASSGRLS